MMSFLAIVKGNRKFHSRVHRTAKWPASTIEKSRRHIFELVIAKHTFNNKILMNQIAHDKFSRQYRSEMTYISADTAEELTTELLSKKLGVSERTIRRFENEQSYMPSASFVFKYASLVNMELRLEVDYDIDNRGESSGDFYIRRILALYDWIRNPPNIIPVGA